MEFRDDSHARLHEQYFPALPKVSVRESEGESQPAGERIENVNEAICRLLWSIDKDAVLTVAESVVAEDEDAPPFSWPCTDENLAVNEVHLASIARRLSDIFPDEWQSCAGWAQDGQERCLAQQEALSLACLDLAGALRLQEQIEADELWLWQQAQEQGQEQQERQERRQGSSGIDGRARDTRARPKALPAHTLGFRTAGPSSTAIAGTSLQACASHQGPSMMAPGALTVSAQALLGALECKCGAGIFTQQGGSHSRSCLQSLYQQAHAQEDELRQRRIEKARQGAELTRRFARQAPGAGAAHAEEAKAIAVKQQAARQVADLAMFWLTNPGAASRSGLDLQSAAVGVLGGCTHGTAGRRAADDLYVAHQRGELLTGPGARRLVQGAPAGAWIGGSSASEALQPLVTLDLHGLSADGAVGATRHSLSTAVAQGHTRVRFISGVGKHSWGGKSTVREAVGKVLRQLQELGEPIFPPEGEDSRDSGSNGAGGLTRVGYIARVTPIASSAGFDVTLTLTKL